MILEYCGNQETICIIETFIGFIPLLFLIFFGIKSLQYIIRERYKIYKRPLGFKGTKTYKFKFIFLIIAIILSLMELTIYIVENAHQELNNQETQGVICFYIVIYLIFQMLFPIAQWFLVRIEFNFLGHSTPYTFIIVSSQIVCNFITVICSFINRTDYQENGFYIYILILINYIAFLAYLLKYKYDISQELIEQKLAKLDYLIKKKKLLRKKKNLQNQRKTPNDKRNYQRFVPYWLLNDNQKVEFTEEEINQILSEQTPVNNKSPTLRNQVQQPGKNGQQTHSQGQNNLMTVPEHPQLRSSTAESAQFNALNQSQQLLTQSQSESFLEDEEQNFCDFLIPEQVCVVGWDIVPDRNEIYFIIESETEEVIEFTKRSPKEFRILFKQLVKNDKSFNKAYQAMSKIKCDSNIEKMELYRNLINHNLQKLIQSNVFNTSFRQFLSSETKVYGQHLLMSFGQNDFRKLTQRQSEFNYSFGGGGPTTEIKKSILSNNGNRCSQKINNGYSFDMQQSLLDQSIISNSLSSYSYKEMSTQISYTYIYADKFEKNLLCEESEKYIYTIQFTNPQLKYNYQVKRTYSDFLSLSEYMQELYQNQSLDYNEQYNKALKKNNLNQNNIDQQDDMQDKDAENKREIINKFFVHVIKQRLWTLNLKLFLEQNKEQNIQYYIKNNQIMKDLYGSLLQSQQLYSNDNSSQVASVVIHSQFSGQKSSQTQKSHQSEFSFR